MGDASRVVPSTCPSEFHPFTSVWSHGMHIRPLHDRIIVQRVEESTLAGSIVIPDSAKEKPQQGKVIATGSGRYTDEGTRVPLDVKAGDIILFGKYSGQEIKLDGEEYLVMREDDVLAAMNGAGLPR